MRSLTVWTRAPATSPTEVVIVPIELQVGGARLEPRDLGEVKPKQLLEVLLIGRGRAVPKDRIAELLWGEALPRRAAATIETYVSHRSRPGGPAPAR